MKKVAFFDIDGTIFRSSLLIEVVEKLVEKDIFPKEAKEFYLPAYSAWRKREGEYGDYIKAVVLSFMEHIKGVHYGELRDIARMVANEQGSYVYRYTRDLVTKLKSNNYFVVAISHSPKTILDEFCREYGFDKVYGRIYEIGPQDRFTGVIENLADIEDKASIVERVLEKEDVTNDDSYGVGDTDGDITLLECVQNPICFNPNKKLYMHAQKVGWKVVVERKDVIYEL